MSLTSTDQLAAFAANFSSDDLPDSTKTHARYLLLDAVACALASDFGDETSIFFDFARNAGGRGDVSIIGAQERLSPLGATLLNGFQITAATVCDTYLPAHVHITPEVVPPALAIAEQDGLDGRSLLAAIAIGSEVMVRLAAGINYGVAGKRGWHMPGVLGPFGAAAAVGRLRKLSPEQMLHAFGIAGSQSAGTWASWGTPTVKFHQARGGASGLIAALLAEQNFRAGTDVITHPDGGLFTTYTDGSKPEVLLGELGERFKLEEIALRLWPGAAALQPALTALFDLIGKEQLEGNVERIRIEVAPSVHEAHAHFVRPKGTFEALLSFHFAVASALRDGHFWLTSVAPDKIEDPDLVRFMSERIDIVASDDLDREKGRIHLHMADGRTLSGDVDAARGTQRNPASLDDLCTKYRQCAAGRLSEEESDELLDLIVRIEELDDLERFFELLRMPRHRASRGN